MITLHIPEATPSLNQFRRHWARLYQLQSHWDALVRQAVERWVYDDGGTGRLRALDVQARMKQLAPTGRRRVTIVRSSPHALDEDNFLGGLKPIIDSLRLRRAKRGGYHGNHLLEDDALANLEHGDHRQVLGPPGTVIIIEDQF